jgi:hypothetical protein
LSASAGIRKAAGSAVSGRISVFNQVSC